MRVFLWVIAGVVCSTTLRAETFDARVLEVKEGDTLKVLDRDGRTRVFRLLAADAPQKKQDGYVASKLSLMGWLLGKVISVEWANRKICETQCVELARAWFGNEDIAVRQIRLGHAWHDMRQLADQPTADRITYEEAQHQAAARKKGLWAFARPKAPWEFVPAASKRAPASKKKKRSKR
jgi:endonuclease YncB( thermonuclease family)